MRASLISPRLSQNAELNLKKKNKPDTQMKILKLIGLIKE
jgi:hypothetical protein